jgi:single-strand DNA-binding protein
MNKIILIGRVTKDIELKSTPSGVSVADFSLAVTRNYKNANGDYEVDFINCIAYRKLAETISNYVKKGDKLAVEGKLQTRNYTNNEGKKVYVSEVIVESIDFLEAKKAEPKEEPVVNDPFAYDEQLEINVDDLPFE